VKAQFRPSECLLHSEEGQEPWCPPLKNVETVRCDHLGSAYVVEMFLHAGSDGTSYRSHHIHFVRDGRREVHALADDLSQEMVDRVWHNAIAAMERGEAPQDHEAQFHSQAKL
jgi:hypothetical protein